MTIRLIRVTHGGSQSSGTGADVEVTAVRSDACRRVDSEPASLPVTASPRVRDRASRAPRAGRAVAGEATADRGMARVSRGRAVRQELPPERLGRGDAVAVPPGVEHALAAGDHGCELLEVTVPPHAG